MKSIFRSAFAAALVAMLVATAALAQTYPANPTYVPNAIAPSQTLSTTGNSTAIQLNNLGTLDVRILGTNSGLTATVQVALERSGTITWTSIAAQDLANGIQKNALSGNGLYRFNVAGYSQARLNISALGSGTVIMTAAAGSPQAYTNNEWRQKATYRAVIAQHAPAATPTDFLTVTGSASAVIRVTRVQCDGAATAIGTFNVRGVVRSTADSAGTPAAVTAVPLDSNNAAATATVQSWAGGLPTLGTLVGIIRAENLELTPPATTTYGAGKLDWRFGEQPGEQEVVLRGITQVFALNGNGAALPSGSAFSCSISLTEE